MSADGGGRGGGPVARLRRTALRHARWTIAVTAAVGLAGALVIDVLAPGLAARLPVTANLVAGLLGAPVILVFALLFLDPFTAAERRRGWVNRNQQELLEYVPSALGAVEAAVRRSWPVGEASELTRKIEAAVDGLERMPGEVASVGPDTAIPELRRVLEPVARVLVCPDLEELENACLALFAALEPLALQNDAPRLAEVTTDVRVLCTQFSSSLKGDAYLARRFVSDVQFLAATATTWVPRGELLQFVTETSSRSMSPASLVRPGFVYLRQLDLIERLVDLCSALRREISRTL